MPLATPANYNPDYQMAPNVVGGQRVRHNNALFDDTRTSWNDGSTNIEAAHVLMFTDGAIIGDNRKAVQLVDATATAADFAGFSVGDFTNDITGEIPNINSIEDTQIASVKPKQLLARAVDWEWFIRAIDDTAPDPNSQIHVEHTTEDAGRVTTATTGTSFAIPTDTAVFMGGVLQGFDGNYYAPIMFRNPIV